jgi:hypothetical protein
MAGNCGVNARGGPVGNDPPPPGPNFDEIMAKLANPPQGKIVFNLSPSFPLTPESRWPDVQFHPAFERAISEVKSGTFFPEAAVYARYLFIRNNIPSEIRDKIMKMVHDEYHQEELNASPFTLILGQEHTSSENHQTYLLFQEEFLKNNAENNFELSNFFF